jgi:hypothetical protein
MKKHAAQESGAALVVAMMLMLVLAIVLIGFFFVTEGEQKVAASNKDNGVTYYWAVAGLEQMSNLIADYFAYNASPTPAGITAWASNSSNFYTYPTLISTSGLPLVTASYTLYCWPPQTPGPCSTTPNLVLCSTVSGNVLGNCNGTIGGNGPLAGLEGIITPLILQVTADGSSNTEVKLNRRVDQVAVPIFEFGIFSDSDLSFHAGAPFNFGGRVHTNGNLFLAEDAGYTVNMNDHVTAAKSIIRDQLVNGYTMATYPGNSCQYTGSYCAYVNVLTQTNGCPATLSGLQTGNGCVTLQLQQGSVENGPGSTANPNWITLSEDTYKYFIEDSQTGGKVLNIAIALPGISAQPIAMIQRPPFSESPSSALGMARFYNQASLRILLSDTAGDITSLPGIDNTVAPYPLAEAGSSGMSSQIQRTNSSNPYYLPPIDGCHPPLAESAGDNNNMLAANYTTLGGYIKIEMQCAATAGCASTWKDVTQEILAQGISRDEASGTMDTMPAATLATASGGSLAASTTYYYTVTALGPWGESAGTQASKKTGNTHKTIQLTWPNSGQAVTGATSYNVYRTTTSGTYTGTGNGVISLVVGTAQAGWASPWTSYTDSGATAPTSSSGPPSPCTNNSIIHLEEAKTGLTLCPAPVGVEPAPPCTSAWSASGLYAASAPANFVPINMYDAREGEVRDTEPSNNATVSLNGIMNLVEVDVGNLQQWFAGNIATSGKWAFNGPDALNNAGYILYTSDRRMNCMDGQYEVEGTCALNAWTGNVPTAGESGEFGNEDIINPGNPTGTPNGQLDPPEDVDGTIATGNPVLYTYGAYAHPIAAPTATWSSIVTSVGTTATTNPAFVRIAGPQAQENSVVIFRRALRLVNGTLGNLPPLAAAQASTCSGGTAGGFTVVSENPIYIQGDYNSSVANGFSDVSGKCHVPAAVIGDTVTLLSNNWTPGAQSGSSSGDYNDFANPDNPNCPNRCATTTYYRMAVMGGKTIPFPAYNGTTALLNWGVQDTGSDGGIHNFLRYIEDWNNIPLNYLGSLASFYVSRQATGIYKCCNNVYNPPTRNYTFDTDFQSISKLPPGTPRFTDVNALSYYQSILPSQ